MTEKDESLELIAAIDNVALECLESVRRALGIEAQHQPSESNHGLKREQSPSEKLRDEKYFIPKSQGEVKASFDEADPAFESLLNYLWQRHNFNLTGYQRRSLMRRLHLRMQLLQIERCSDYQDYLEREPQEFVELFNIIEINVTSFFRDASSWEKLAVDIIPQIVAAKSPEEPIRVWSAGCASGEEVYSLAIVLAEILGKEQYSSRVKIYGTDVDLEAINEAREGSYDSSKVFSLTEALLNKYFEQTENRYIFRPDLRHSITFGRHNMIEDAPMSQIDLLVCRNALIYFNIETQVRVLARFHFSLKDSGFLFLGKAEMVPTSTNLFAPVEMWRQFYTKVPRSNIHGRLLNKSLLRQRPKTKL
jgi:two-component system CheB/CheR fusion protein